MKKFHKMVTPPPCTAFMKSLFRTLTVFLNVYICSSAEFYERKNHKPGRGFARFHKTFFFSKVKNILLQALSCFIELEGGAFPTVSEYEFEYEYEFP